MAGLVAWWHAKLRAADELRGGDGRLHRLPPLPVKLDSRIPEQERGDCTRLALPRGCYVCCSACDYDLHVCGGCQCPPGEPVWP